MKVLMMQQLSPEWWEARRGLPTASSFDRILTAGGKPSTQQEDFIDELLGDVMFQGPNYFSQYGPSRAATNAMRNGQDTEPEARRWYEFDQGAAVQQVGFCVSDCGRMGCSPDGLVGDEGGLELKCPLLRTQIGYLRKGILPTEYRCQVHGSLIITGRRWWDFVSYAPGVPGFRVRVTPDEFTERLRAELERFLERYHAAAKRLGVILSRPDGEVLEPQPAEIGGAF